MKWAWRLGSFRGIGVFVHATFLLLLGWILLSHLLRGHNWGTALAGAAFILLLFACVVLHEFGHALTAQRFGVQTRDITLYPIGGVARLERIPRDPGQELLIALAGPAVNVVIAVGLFLLMTVSNALGGWDQFELVGGNLLSKLMWVNVSLAVFNLLPAFPMDGGRVLRAFLAQRMEYGKATQIAAHVGQAMAFLFGFLGLIGNPFLLFIAFFVYLGASQEAATVQAELAFRGVPVRDAMMTRFGALHPDDTLQRATEQLLSGPQHDYPVLQDSRVVGLLTRMGLLDGLSRRGPESRVAQAMAPSGLSVSPTDSLENTFQCMREAELPAVPVFEEGRMVGLITLENIGEFLMVRQAAEALGRGGAGSPARDLLTGERTRHDRETERRRRLV